MKKILPNYSTEYDKNAKLLKSLGSANLERGYGYNKKKVIKFIEDNK
jgi:hypothetical protein